MSNVKAVVIRRDSSGNMTNRVMTTPKSVNVIQEGLRASDSMTMLLSAEHNVRQGDEIYYIQDVLDTINLKALWNFYGGFRDESGYEHDDVYVAPHTMPDCVSSSLVENEASIDWKHKGYYKFLINATSDDGIKIEKKFKNNDTSASKIPVIDMSGDFDMIFEFKTTNNTDGQTLFDNYDHATSSGKGLKIVINPASTNITITADDGTTETVMVAGSITSYNTVVFVRIRRQEGVFKLYLGDVEKTLTNSTNSGNLNSNQDIHFFKEYNESTSAYIANTGWKGVPIQFRLYNTALSDDEVKKLRVSKPVNTTMKFGGKIWKIDDKLSNKKLICSSHAKELLGTQIGTKLFNSVPTATLTSGGARSYNRYYATGSNSNTRPDMEDIIQDILKYVDDGVYTYFAKEPSTSFQGDFIAEGSFLDILKVMMIIDSDDHMFVVTPRKVLLISDEVETNQVINNNGYNIIYSGKDDTSTCNSLFVTGRRKMYTYTKTFTNLNITQNTWSASQTFTAQDGFRPVVERIVKVTRSGTEVYGDFRAGSIVTNTPTSDTYRVLEDNTIQFWNDSTGNIQTWVIVYEYSYTYDPTVSYSLSQSSTQHRQDSTSITINGIYHRNFNIPQLVSGYDITTFATRYIADFKDINTRQRAKTSRLVNSLTVGQKVRFTNSEGTTIDSVVRSIEYSYPQTITIIELGEYLFSGFDVEKQTIDSVRALDSSTSISRY
jgi:hypothetical protein|tara:strand:- start:4447 stop:6603 length:2157 start_codon:yes stop_codon:yes gene_type:complete